MLNACENNQNRATESGRLIKANRVPEFEGLRGILAAWVIFGHILLFSGFTYTDGLFGIIFSPVLGVYVFMMLSGFVVTYALDSGSAKWLEFMRRRFFRIYPVYVICVLVAIAMSEVSRDVALKHPGVTFGLETEARLDEVRENFWLYAFADSLLVQTLLPRAIFPNAHETFLPPTWSLSLEWMFYLVMPLLIGLCRQRWWIKSLGLAALVAGIALCHEPMTKISPSLNLATGSYFLTGILSFFVWKKLPRIRGRRQWFAIGLFWGLLGIGMALTSLPFKLWFATLAVVLYDRVHSRRVWPLEFGRWILNCRPINFLGQVSYSSYLVHWVVIEICLFNFFTWLPSIDNRIAIAVFACVTVYPVTYAASWLMFKYVERPCNTLSSLNLFPRLVPMARQVG